MDAKEKNFHDSQIEGMEKIEARRVLKGAGISVEGVEPDEAYSNPNSEAEK